MVLAPKHKVDSGVLDQSIEIIRSRVDAIGVAEPDISRQGNSIVVQLPGVKNKDRALQLVGTTAQLFFRPVIQALPATDKPPVTTTTAPRATTTTVAGATTTAPATTTTAPANDVSTRTTPRENDKPGATVVLPMKDRNGNVTQRLQLGPSELTGRAISTARANLDANGRWLVEFTWRRSTRWACIT